LKCEIEIDLYRVAIGFWVCPSLHVAAPSRYVCPHEGDEMPALRGSSVSMEGWLAHGVDSGTMTGRRAKRHVTVHGWLKSSWTNEMFALMYAV